MKTEFLARPVHMLLFTLCCISGYARAAECQFEMPGVFKISTHGTLYMDVPSGWHAAVEYSVAEPATATMPAITPSPLIKITRSNDIHICFTPFDKSKAHIFHGARKALDRDPQGNPVARRELTGPHVTGTVCSPPKNHPKNYFRSHGDLVSGDLMMAFTTAVDDTNVWHEIETLLKSLRFETE